LAAWSSRFAHWLDGQGVARGERVAIMLEPSLPFYGALFGAVRRGAIAVPLFTLFGPEGLALRIRDCSPTILLADREAARWQSEFPGVRVVTANAAFEAALAAQPAEDAPATAADALAVFQYTSGPPRCLASPARVGARRALPVPARQALLHGRAHGRRHLAVHRGDVRRHPAQHVRIHRGGRGHRELPRVHGIRGATRGARHGRPRPGGGHRRRR